MKVSSFFKIKGWEVNYMHMHTRAKFQFTMQLNKFLDS